MTIPRSDEQRQAKRADFLARWEQLGWKQNEAARRAGFKNPGLVSRVLNSKAISANVWIRLERVTATAERRRLQRVSA